MRLLDGLREAVRVLARAPGFSALAIAILATGIGATTLMFSLVHAALLRTLPFDDPTRVDVQPPHQARLPCPSPTSRTIAEASRTGSPF